MRMDEIVKAVLDSKPSDWAKDPASRARAVYLKRDQGLRLELSGDTTEWHGNPGEPLGIPNATAMRCVAIYEGAVVGDVALLALVEAFHGQLTQDLEHIPVNDRVAAILNAVRE